MRVILLAGAAAAVYETLKPFGGGAGSHLVWRLQWHQLFLVDTVLNVAAYVPMGVVTFLLYRRRGSSRWGDFLRTLATLAALSYTTECLQGLVPGRVPSWVDLCCNTVGGAMGALLAPVVQRVVRNAHALTYA